MAKGKSMKMGRMAPITAAALLCVAGTARAQINEHFDSLSGPVFNVPSTLNGWTFQNSANPAGGFTFYQGDTSVFPAFATPGYMAANYNNSTGANTISSWAVTPMVLLQNGNKLDFYARTVDEVFYPDRLQVRLSVSGASTNVGQLQNTAAVGDFTTLLLDINPSYTSAGFPHVWTEYTITLSGLPPEGVQGRFAFRYFVENGGPNGPRSDYIGIDEVVYPAATVTGACCFPDGSCSTFTASTCTASGGTYSGDNVTCAAASCPQPPSGACCAPNGTCTFVTAAACATANGVWSGAGITCAAANCQPTGWAEVGDAGDLPGTANAAIGNPSAPLTRISGTLVAGDVDMFAINICDAANWSASTLNGATFDTQMFLFKADGTGVAADDDYSATTLQSILTSVRVAPLGNGLYYLAISGFDNDPLGASTSTRIWSSNAQDAAPDGPAAAQAVGSWSGGGEVGAYTIALTGSCYVGSLPCYANCDGSTASPLLTANDFQCFLNSFAASESYANCDNSTAAPVLTANDFQCFLNKYAAGCS